MKDTKSFKDSDKLLNDILNEDDADLNPLPDNDHDDLKTKLARAKIEYITAKTEQLKAANEEEKKVRRMIAEFLGE
jgi:hypothetical protein